MIKFIWIHLNGRNPFIRLLGCEEKQFNLISFLCQQNVTLTAELQLNNYQQWDHILSPLIVLQN